MSLGIKYTSYCRLDIITLLSADNGGPIYDIYDRETGRQLDTIVLPPNDNVFPESTYKVSRYIGGKGGSQFIGLIVQSNGESQEIEIPCEPAQEVRRGRVAKDNRDGRQPLSPAQRAALDLSPEPRRVVNRLIEKGDKNPELREELQRRVKKILDKVKPPAGVEDFDPLGVEAMLEANPLVNKLLNFIYPEDEAAKPLIDLEKVRRELSQPGYPVRPGPRPCCPPTPNAHKSSMWFYKSGDTNYLTPFDGQPESGMVFWRFLEDMFDEPPWLWHDPERLQRDNMQRILEQEGQDPGERPDDPDEQIDWGQEMMDMLNKINRDREGQGEPPIEIPRAQQP